ncbi:MAG TPA: GlsB/YeaQ/YmgE family stress response membrane protein [Actinocatenispora sp.]
MIGTIIWAIVAGAVLGVLARIILPGRQNISWWLTILVGIVAAFLGGLVATWLGVGDTRGIDWIRHIIQVVFALVGVAIVAGVGGRRRTS